MNLQALIMERKVLKIDATISIRINLWRRNFNSRNEIYVEETGGGVKVLLNTGTYEVFRTAIHEYFCGEGEGSTLSTFPWLTIMVT